ncbi:peptide methionine sulfoxide reductase [Phytophthora infestans T30-4]|uniref:peptide-methionine (S)-S-oxide reductase n=1 Tax=Phytophthora infestans (strain T30-4) TaxID=403677 RepID=D0NRY9_PHYIT|nr:peptide methionine sulfoxide reductase [Phytophthora infestans T30-4]EEY63530.1 peptide methionine sulfoxide reductase [Phytophthora infestans T30-4]|eukprot:XP_002898117.1 peptide methionine sulfoxide reductase [Phytophthora infestans T30-4]
MTEISTYSIATFAAGCFWAVQRAFDRVPGVIETSQGDLLKVFWAIHDPTSLNRQEDDVGTQYRSGIYYQNEEQHKIALTSKEEHQKTLIKPIVTEIEEAKEFWDAEEAHQKYLEKGGSCSDKGSDVQCGA